MAGTETKNIYVIEGTISELSFDEGYFTICGSEGFAIKQGDKKYNVLCPEKMPKEKEVLASYVLSTDVNFSIEGKHKDLLIQIIPVNKKIKLKIKKEEIDKVLTTKSSEKKDGADTTDNQTENESALSVSSITLLSD